MNPRLFGDSFDIVKRFFIKILKDAGYEVYVEPMFTLALHKSSIFYYSLITLLSATHQENAGDLGVQPD